MKKTVRTIQYLFIVLLSCEFCSCERLDNDVEKHVEDKNPAYIELHELVEIMTLLPITNEQMGEVYAAVSSSSVNGYDEEYTMANLFSVPGAGVGDKVSRSGAVYNVPMRDLINDVVKDIASLESRAKSQYESLNVFRTLDRVGVDAFLDALSRSDMQIYWPFSEGWD